MNWNTIYITGNDNFWEEVNKKLSQSTLSYLNGFMEQLANGQYQALYWLDNRIDLRDFKEAISGKVIWKYRLHFFRELEQPIENKEVNNKPETLSLKEHSLLNAMRAKNSMSA